MGGKEEENKGKEKGRKKGIILMPNAFTNYTLFKKKNGLIQVKRMHIYVRKYQKSYISVYTYVYKCTEMI